MRMILALALALWGAAAMAQAQPVPGRIEQELRVPPEPVRRNLIRIDTPRFAEQAPQGAGQAMFTLGSVQLQGNTALPTARLLAALPDKLGQRISLADAFGLAAAVSALYRDAGFVLSQAVIPPQDLPTDAPALLRIQVLEGYVDQVRFTGIDGAALAAYLAPVRAERPLRLATLERCLLLLSELPGISAQANLRAGSVPNASDLEIVVTRRVAEGSLSVHNRSAPAQGRLRIEAAGEVRGLLGAFDRHSLRVVSSGDKRLSLLGYNADVPLDGSGLKLQFGGSASRSQPTGTVVGLDTRSDSFSAGLGTTVQRSRVSNLSLRAALGVSNNQADTAGGTASQDRLRAWRVGLTTDYADTVGGITLLDLEYVKGLTGLGASKAGDPLLLGANPAFGKFTAYAARLQSLGGNLSALLAATAQSSGDKLPNSEQLGLGGEVFLRAYDPSEVIGENGFAGKLELRWNLQALAGTTLNSTLYAYADSGRVKRRQVGAPDQSVSLTAVGAGARLSGPWRTRGYLELAKPVNRDVASQGNRKARVFAGLGIDF